MAVCHYLTLPKMKRGLSAVRGGHPTLLKTAGVEVHTRERTRETLL